MSAQFRLPCAAALTASMFTLAAEAHVLAGGTLPEPGIAAGLCAVMLAPVMMLTGVRISAPVMAVALGSAQIILQWAFSAFSVLRGSTPVAGTHFHGIGSSLPAAASLMAGHAADPGILMVVVHAGAALLTALVWRRLRLPALRGPPSGFPSL